MPVDSAKLLEFSVETGLDSPLDTQGDYLVLTPVNLELLLHAKALQTFFNVEQPLMVPVHPTDKGKLHFFVRDASRDVFDWHFLRCLKKSGKLTICKFPSS